MKTKKMKLRKFYYSEILVYEWHTPSARLGSALASYVEGLAFDDYQPRHSDLWRICTVQVALVGASL